MVGWLRFQAPGEAATDFNGQEKPATRACHIFIVPIFFRTACKIRMKTEPVSFREIVSRSQFCGREETRYETQTIRCSGGVRSTRAGSARVRKAWGCARQHATRARRCRDSGEGPRPRPRPYASRRPRPSLWMGQRPWAPLRLAPSPPLLEASLVSHCPDESELPVTGTGRAPDAASSALHRTAAMAGQPRPISTAIRIKSE
jgi:hypothetical protein